MKREVLPIAMTMGIAVLCVLVCELVYQNFGAGAVYALTAVIPTQYGPVPGLYAPLGIVGFGGLLYWLSRTD